MPVEMKTLDCVGWWSISVIQPTWPVQKNKGNTYIHTQSQAFKPLYLLINLVVFMSHTAILEQEKWRKKRGEIIIREKNFHSYHPSPPPLMMLSPSSSSSFTLVTHTVSTISSWPPESPELFDNALPGATTSHISRSPLSAATTSFDWLSL